MIGSAPNRAQRDLSKRARKSEKRTGARNNLTHVLLLLMTDGVIAATTAACTRVWSSRRALRTTTQRCWAVVGRSSCGRQKFSLHATHVTAVIHYHKLLGFGPGARRFLRVRCGAIGWKDALVIIGVFVI